MKILSVCLLVLVSLSACFRSTPPAPEAKDIKYSGFLGSDYRLLKKQTSDDRARLVYRNPKADFTRYGKVILEPVQVWRAPKSDGMSREDMQTLSNYFYGKVREDLRQNYSLVTYPEPGTLKVQLALTGADSPNAILDVMSTIVPFGRALSELKQVGTGKATSVGSAAVELKISDAYTGELLTAAVDERWGTKGVTTMGSSTGDARKIMDWWSALLNYRLCGMSGRANCEAPSDIF